MWNLSKSEVVGGYRFVIHQSDNVISYREALDLLKSDQAFRVFLSLHYKKCRIRHLGGNPLVTLKKH